MPISRAAPRSIPVAMMARPSRVRSMNQTSATVKATAIANAISRP